LSHAKKIIIATSIILLITTILAQQIQISQLNSQIEKINELKQWLLNHYGVSSIEELKTKLTQETKKYHGNPFTTALYPGQFQAENITGMHWYTWLSGTLYNRTDVIAFPEQTATFIIFGKDTDGDGVYDIVYAKNTTSGQIQYGGEWDAGGVDGSNASAVIQASVSALSRGGNIFIKAGDYYITSEIKLTEGITIEGEGYDAWSPYATRLIQSGNTNIFHLEGSHADHINCVQIKNMFLYGNRSNYSGNAIVSDYGGGTLLQDLYIFNFKGYGIVMTEEWDSTLIHVVVEDCGDSATGKESVAFLNSLEGNTSGIYVFNLRIMRSDYNSLKMEGYRLEVYQIQIEQDNTKDLIAIDLDADYCKIIGGRILYGSGTTNYLIDVSGDFNVLFGLSLASKPNGIKINGRENEVSGCDFYNFSNIALYVGFTGGDRQNRIIGNVFDSISGVALMVRSEGQVCVGNVFRTISGTAVDLYPNNPFVGNSFYDITGTKIVLRGSGHVIGKNYGYVTENSGTATVANGEYIAHGIDSSLNIGQSNSSVLITEYTKVYDGVPVTVGCDFVNATHFRVAVYWVNGTAITDDAIQIWWQVKYTG